MIKNLVTATALTFAALTMSVGSANAVTYNCNYTCVDGAGTEDNLGANTILTAEVNGNAIDGGGFLAFGFNFIANVLSIETNSLNPITGFLNATVEWNTQADGLGTVLASLTNAQVIAGTAMNYAFSNGDLAYLVLRWDDVSEDGSNFDVRIKTNDEIPGVPVPPALLLLGTGLLGMGALARRRKSAN